MQKKTWTSIGFALFSITAILVILANVVFVWVSTGPRSLSAITPYIEKGLNPEHGEYRVSIHNTLLVWDGWSHPIDLRAEDVRLLTPSGKIFASFHEISLGLNLSSLLLGRVEPRSIALRNPDIKLFQAPDGKITFGFGEEGGKNSLPVSVLFSGFYADSSTRRHSTLDSFSIVQGQVALSNAAGQVVFNAPHVNFSMHRIRDHFNGEFSMVALEDEITSAMHGKIQLEEKDLSFRAQLEFADLLPRMIYRLYPVNTLLDTVDFPINGIIRMQGDSNKISRLDFTMENHNGTLVDEALFPKPLSFRHLVARGFFLDNFRELHLQDVQCDTRGPTLSARGALIFNEHSPGIHIIAHAKNLPMNDLPHYWPIPLEPDVRNWVLANIKEGMAADGSIVMNFEPGDLDLVAFPKYVLSARAEGKQVNVSYLPGYPVVKGVDGVATFDGKTLHVEGENGTAMSGTQVKKGVVHIEDMNIDNANITIALELAAPALDAANFLALPGLNFAKPLALDTAQIKGSVDGSLNLEFRLPSTHNSGGAHSLSDVAVKTKAALTGIAQNHLLNRYDVQDLNGTLEASNSELLFKGKGKVSGVANTLDLIHYFHGGKEFDTYYNVQGMITSPQLALLGYISPSFLTGAMGVNATVTQKKETMHMALKLDLTQANLDFAAYGWSKRAGVPAQYESALEQEGAAPATLEHFTLQGAGMTARGSGMLSGDMKSIEGLRLDSLAFGNTNIAAAYGVEKGRTRLEVKGASLDLSPYLAHQSDYTTSRLKNLDLRAELDKVILKAGRELTNVKVGASCNESYCPRANFSGKAGGKDFSFQIASAGAGRTLQGSASSAGEFVKALGFYDNMEGGVLTLSGKFDDTTDSHPLSGKLQISEHALKKAPVLTKLLTIASLTGIVDTLQGNGITFTRLSAPFTMKKDVLTLKEAKTYGPSIGITAEGSIDLPKKQLDIEGTIVPAYTLNSFFGKIPVIGALAGGKGEGLFAARYSLKGSMYDPVVSLNPLSILTPGFLRNLFDIFDSKPVDEGAGATAN